MKTLFVPFWKKIREHSFIACSVAILVLWGGYYAYGKLTAASTETRYVLAVVQKGTLITSVSGTGQVSVSNQVDLKSKVSGSVVSIPAQEGQTVKAGTVLLRLDATIAEKAVRDAEANLLSAQIALQKLTQPADALSLLQAQDALTQATQAKQNAQDGIAKAYDDGFNSVSNTFIDLPGIVSGLDGILNGKTINGNQNNVAAYYDMVKNSAANADKFYAAATDGYAAARAAYDKTVLDYKNASHYSDRATIDTLISGTYDTTKTISEALKNVKSFLDMVSDTFTSNSQNIKPPALLATHESSLQGYITTANGHLGDILNIKNTITGDEDAIANGDQTIAEKTESLAKLKAGADPLDVRSQELSVTERQNALLDARETLADYSIRAPFDAVVAKIDVQQGDDISGGTLLATAITSEKIAQVSLNEVDVAKVALGAKATLTFDAFPDLTLTGKVVQIDTIGTVAQGVVTYNVKIAFDTQDDRVKPAMSVSAAIITDTKQDVITVPNAAVKSQGGNYYVQIPDASQGSAPTSSGSQGVPLATSPMRQAVVIGIANDSMTEITSGLREGDVIVVRAIATSTQTTTQGGTGFRLPGFGGGRGG